MVIWIRPLIKKEVEENPFEIVKVLDEKVIVLLDPANSLEPEDVTWELFTQKQIFRKNRNKEL